MEITFSEAERRFHYCPMFGHIYKKTDDGLQRVGRTTSDGYRFVLIDGRYRAEHRLIWLLAHGEWPKQSVDHVNRVKDDNRLCNLRLATRSQNAMNQTVQRRSASGLKGVSRTRTNRWTAGIGYARKRFGLGSYKTAKLASAAYAAAAEILHGSFACHDCSDDDRNLIEQMKQHFLSIGKFDGLAA